ncbi:triose-phosphate isomerase [Levilactobacillus tujiorum]|uniref:Triosephosphate isomerase n=1 Tax=Levilactobacillus tujiorum TaxID=2912243 RepID=A0ABX1L313_9LACO|nr:triose-phosphate isomerase [Levilactobacillus tujiorum]MCH5464485.1 triose-phosphate isomerase [Levilactobacillus tujiorum]NLR11505.1 triose-phosphate isomerase [Lactobacillus sp. HBUAS51387]NLR29413.1 triose-phosphate isomerase [Levilactobacillus tujiorum]NLR32702.1 triose-phosphate isomerase [Levilactobacillus tujiorum]
MRIPLIAGNWKMNKSVTEARSFIEAVQGKLPAADVVETAIAAPALFLQTMLDANRDQVLRVAAETCYYEDEGAYTGETSPKALHEMGIPYTIVGHSERRRYFNETDDVINRKVLAVLRNGMTPIVCCDETMGRRESGEKIHWVVNQVSAALKGVSLEDAAKIVVAYEPSWAIGSGTSASSDQAEEGCYLIRQTLADIYSDEVANGVRVLYGGSVKPDNIAGLMKRDNVDGVLAGGSSLDEHSFIQLANYQNL